MAFYTCALGTKNIEENMKEILNTPKFSYD